jgi:hypothetical protein
MKVKEMKVKEMKVKRDKKEMKINPRFKLFIPTFHNIFRK